MQAQASHSANANCVSCHMPKRRTDDGVHIVMTDHLIARRPPAGNLLADKPERAETPADSYKGEVVPYYPAKVSGVTGRRTGGRGGAGSRTEQSEGRSASARFADREVSSGEARLLCGTGAGLSRLGRFRIRGEVFRGGCEARSRFVAAADSVGRRVDGSRPVAAGGRRNCAAPPN